MESDPPPERMLQKTSLIGHDSEYSLHHEFSEASALRSLDKRRSIINKISLFGNLFNKSMDGKLIQNIATGEVHEGLYQNKIQCLSIGEELYKDFKEKRFEKKTQSLFNVISRTKTVSQEKVSDAHVVKVNVQKETESVQKYVSYAELRGFYLAELFKYEDSCSPILVQRRRLV